MRNARWLVLAIALISSSLLGADSLAQTRRPLTYDDLIAFGRVGDPQVSPEGNLVVYVVDRYSLETNSHSSSLWLTSLENKETRQLTRPQGKSDRQPRWSPDGTTVTFLSNRSGSWQIWNISLEGGEAWQRTDLPVSVSGLEWSPDGQWLAFTAEVYPDCYDPSSPGAILECTRRRDEEKEKSGVQARLYDDLMIRHWDHWLSGTRSHVFVMPAAGGPARDLTPGEASVPPYLGGAREYDFSPDGQELAFARNLDPDEELSTNSDVWVVPVSGGEPKKITSNPAWDGSPQYSPDGRWIAYRAMARAGFEADRTGLVLYDRATDTHIELTPNFPHQVAEFVWAPDSRSLYFASVVEAERPLYRVSVPDGTLEPVVKETNNSNLRISPDGARLLFTRQALNRPAEVFQADPATGDSEQVSHVNDRLLAELEMNPGESFTVEGAGGTPVQSWLLKPPGFDPAKKYPVVVLIHGGPQGTWMDGFHFRWNAQLFAAPGYVVVMPNPRGSPGWGQEFIDQITRDWGGKVYEDLMKVVDHVETLPFVDKERICAGGGSYGGYMADWILGHTDRFQCLFSHAGVYNTRSMYGATEELWFVEWEFGGTPWENGEVYERWSPSNFVENFRTPTLVIHGQLDYRVPVEQSLELFTHLQRQGVPSKFLYYPDEGHWILKPRNGKLWYETVWAWLAGYLQ